MTEYNNQTETGANVVKIKVDGMKAPVNTLVDRHSKKGLSLVCPFPALAVDLPVTLTDKNGQPQSGRINRIGVEEDPDSGLPKLRLSVCSVNGAQADECAGAVVDLTNQVSQADLTDDAQSMTETSVLLDGILGEVEERSTSELLSLDEVDQLTGSIGKEPAWEDGPLFSSDPMAPVSRTRRRRGGAVLAWTMVLGIATGGGAALWKAGVVDLGSLSANHNVGHVDSKPAVDTLSALNVAEPSPAPETLAKVEAGEPALVKAVAASAVQDESGLVPDSQLDNGDQKVIPQQEGAAVGEAISEPEVPSSLATEVTLPTRWPAEFATAYRLQDPNGVVVDVPGGLVRREGWLKVADDEAIVKSIKAVQRESGARFIVYVKGGLPNFKTTSQKGGIRLSLYYDEIQNGSSATMETQKVAMLD